MLDSVEVRPDHNEVVCPNHLDFGRDFVAPGISEHFESDLDHATTTLFEWWSTPHRVGLADFFGQTRAEQVAGKPDIAIWTNVYRLTDIRSNKIISDARHPQPGGAPFS